MRHELDDLMTGNFSNGLEPFHAMEILAEAKRLEAEGREISHLEVGEPAMPPAPAVLEAVRNALNAPQKYTHSKGTTELRNAIAAYYRAQHGVEPDPERIIVTMGSSAGFILSFLAGFAKGARIAVTRPGYPAYLNILTALGFTPVEIALTPENGWRLSANDVEQAYRDEAFEGLLFASPANPTGAVVSRAALGGIYDVCRQLGVRFISDEIYHGLDYTGQSVSALEFGDTAVIVNSFSKYYCMTGWRVGWLVLPESLVRPAEILQQNMFISASSIGQVAALAALDARAYADAQKARYAENRTVLTNGLTALGFAGGTHSDGAFYAYADASKFTNNSMEFCQRLLREAGVAATPGVDFDRVNGHRYVRFSFAGAPETLSRAIEKMAGFLEHLS